MPTPRKPQQSSASRSRRILVVFAAALLLIGVWVWTQYESVPTPEATSESITNADSLATETMPDTMSQAVAETVPALPSDMEKNVLTKKTKGPKTTPPAAPQPVLPTAAEKSAEAIKPAESVAKPVEPVKPAPVACDRLVMRSGDLLDVIVSEIGVNEIRYKRCNWKDSPHYVVSRADVLSIHFANGDVERF